MTLVQRRLQHQRVVGDRFDTAAQVVRWLGAVQAQDYHQAVWAVGLRTTEPALVAVERAIADREIVTTWPMRGTIHFVPAADAHWMLRLTAARVLAGAGSRLTQLELGDDNIAAGRRAITSALRGGNRLTRPEMMTVLERAGVDPVGQRGYHLLRHVAQEGLVCIGPREGKQQTFVLLDEWVAESRDLARDREFTRDEALAELIWRYFASHGPATAKDFAKWTGLTLTDTRRGLAANTERLVAEDHEGVEHWSASTAEASQFSRVTEPSGVAEFAEVSESAEVQLLPGFDEYLLGYQERRAMLDPAHADRIVPGGNGVFRPMVVWNGRIIGTWRRTLTKAAVNIAVEFFDKPCPTPALTKAAGRYGDFIGLPLGAVTTS